MVACLDSLKWIFSCLQIAHFKSKDLKQQHIIDDHKLQIDRLQQYQLVHTNNITRQQEQINNQSTAITNLQTCTASRVAFTASIGAGKGGGGKLTVSNGQVLKFDEVTLNIGNDYNAHTGCFTCHTPGLYSFRYHSSFSLYENVPLRIFLTV